MPVTPDDFRRGLSRFASGVSVVTAVDAAGIAHGITVSAFSSVSLDPPLILICVEKVTASHDAISETGLFAVNILKTDQSTLSEAFAAPDGVDKFAGATVVRGMDGLPVLEGCLANLQCRVTRSYDGGDHSIFVGSVESVEASNGDPLIYFRGGYRGLDESV